MVFFYVDLKQKIKRYFLPNDNYTSNKHKFCSKYVNLMTIRDFKISLKLLRKKLINRGKKNVYLEMLTNIYESQYYIEVLRYKNIAKIHFYFNVLVEPPSLIHRHVNRLQTTFKF